MRRKTSGLAARRCVAGALLAAAALLTGCSAGEQRLADMAVHPVDSGRGKISLNARDTVYVMLRAGFTREQILELGPMVRNTLAARGGARVTHRHMTRATFLARDDELHGMALEGGPFLYRPVGESSNPDQSPSPDDMSSAELLESWERSREEERD